MTCIFVSIMKTLLCANKSTASNSLRYTNQIKVVGIHSSRSAPTLVQTAVFPYSVQREFHKILIHMSCTKHPAALGCLAAVPLQDLTQVLIVIFAAPDGDTSSLFR